MTSGITIHLLHIAANLIGQISGDDPFDINIFVGGEMKFHGCRPSEPCFVESRSLDVPWFFEIKSIETLIYDEIEIVGAWPEAFLA